MRTTARLFVGGALVGVATLAGSPSALAVCDAYSGGCVEVGVLDTTTSVPATTQVGTPTTLPFTGADLALAAAAGIGAVGVGTALVVAGLRRSRAAA